jgi:hypothetical protein
MWSTARNTLAKTDAATAVAATSGRFGMNASAIMNSETLKKAGGEARLKNADVDGRMSHSARAASEARIPLRIRASDSMMSGIRRYEHGCR